ncbi:MAG: hypothetical protein WC919_03910 [Candidatus Paceibacterota bacterium]|jgi:hypothetical protein
MATAFARALPRLVDDRHNGLINMVMHTLMRVPIITDIMRGNIGNITYASMINSEHYGNSVRAIRFMINMLDCALTKDSASTSTATYLVIAPESSSSSSSSSSYPPEIINSLYYDLIVDFSQVCDALSIVARNPEQLTVALSIGMDYMNEYWTDDVLQLVATMTTMSINDYMSDPHENIYARWSAIEMIYAIAFDNSSLASIIVPGSRINTGELVNSIIGVICDAFNTSPLAHFGVYKYKTCDVCARCTDSVLLRCNHYARESDAGISCDVSDDARVYATYCDLPGFPEFSTRANADIRAVARVCKCQMCECPATREITMYAFSTVAIFTFDDGCHVNQRHFEHTIVLPTVTDEDSGTRIMPGIYRKCGLVVNHEQKYGLLLGTSRIIGPIAKPEFAEANACMVAYNLVNTSIVTRECFSQTTHTVYHTFTSHVHACMCAQPIGECARIRRMHEREAEAKDKDELSAKIPKH